MYDITSTILFCQPSGMELIVICALLSLVKDKGNNEKESDNINVNGRYVFI
jgi:hypothetical protein